MAEFTINKLAKTDSEHVYVLNTTIKSAHVKHKRSTNLAFGINYANQVRSVIIHDSWIPQDLSMQAPKSVILESPDFREAINKGLLELVPDEAAQKILQDEDAILERQRLKNKTNNASLDVDGPKLPNEVIIQKDVDDGISSMVKDLCVHDDFEPVQVFSRLKSSESVLSLDEWKYLSKNLNGACRNHQVDNLIRKHTSAVEKKETAA